MNLLIVSLFIGALQVVLLRLRSQFRFCVPSAPILCNVSSTSDYIERSRAEWLRDDLALFANVHNWRSVSRYVWLLELRHWVSCVVLRSSGMVVRSTPDSDDPNNIFYYYDGAEVEIGLDVCAQVFGSWIDLHHNWVNASLLCSVAMGFIFVFRLQSWLIK
jgi:hypothetical protein